MNQKISNSKVSLVEFQLNENLIFGEETDFEGQKLKLKLSLY